MQQKQWIQTGNKFNHTEVPLLKSNILPFGIYELDWDDFNKNFYIKKISDNFHLPKKMYGVHDSLIDRVCTTYKHLDKNLGVLFKGFKGTGKTVAGKSICNKLEIPVILINRVWPNMGEFINSIEQDVCLFFDEFEKVYSLYARESEVNEGMASVHNLLTLMDGVFTVQHKRLFMLTTNEVYLPDPLVSRPSRIRYINDFGDLTMEQIMEILNDVLEDKTHVDGILKVVCESEYITVDLIKEMAVESNMYGCSTPEFFNMFNLKKKDDVHELIEVFEDNTIQVVNKDFHCSIHDYNIGYGFRDSNLPWYGIVENVNELNGELVVKETSGNSGNKKDAKRHFMKIRPRKFVHSSIVL